MQHEQEIFDYYDWLKKILKIYGKKTTCTNTPPLSWLSRTTQSHTDLVKMFGDTTIVVPIEIQELQLSLNSQQTGLFYTKLRNNVHRDFEICIRSTSYLQFPYVPEQMSKIHKGTKLTKYITHYAQKNWTLGSDKKLALDKILAELGKAWAEETARNGKLYFTLSFNPKAFSALGNLYCDEGSCFGFDRQRYYDRYTLGTLPNSFALFISKEPISEELNASDLKKILARYWGSYDKNRKLWHLCNFYAKSIEHGDIKNGLLSFFKIILNKNKIFSAENRFYDSQSQLFMNDNPRISFSVNEINYESKSLILGARKYRPNLDICTRCAIVTIRSEEGELVDNNLTCDLCAEKANQCELSKELTFQELIAYEVNGKQLKIKPSEVKRLDDIKKTKEHESPKAKDVEVNSWAEYLPPAPPPRYQCEFIAPHRRASS